MYLWLTRELGGGSRLKNRGEGKGLFLAFRVGLFGVLMTPRDGLRDVIHNHFNAFIILSQSIEILELVYILGMIEETST